MNGSADLLPEFAAYCRQQKLLPDNGRIIVGLSGGPDSLVLLDLLQRLSSRRQLQLFAAHLNHCLRGEAADRDERTVRDACASYGIPLFVQKRRIADEAHARGLTTEEAGRLARYAFFDSIAMKLLEQSLLPVQSMDSLQCPPLYEQMIENEPYRRMAPEQAKCCLNAGIQIAVGHHQNDQSETVLLNLCRGSGLQGLAGMMPQNCLIIRPLLSVSRERIEEYASMRSLSPCIDQTNTDPVATRNRIRLFVLPAINGAFGSDAGPAIARAARLLRDDAEYLNCEAALQFERLRSTQPVAENGSGVSFPDRFPGSYQVSLSVGQLAALHPAIRSRVLRLWYERAFGDVRNLSEKHVAAMSELCLPNRSGHLCSLPGGRRTIRDFDRLILAESEESIPSEAAASCMTDQAQQLIIPGTTIIPDINAFFVTQFIENEQQIVYNNKIWCFSIANLTGAVVRHRQPQDHFWPEGRAHGKTLKKYLTEWKIPVFVRDRLPMIACGSEVIWVPGVAAAAELPKMPDPVALSRHQWVSIRYVAPDTNEEAIFTQ